jgi:hypothetical protein
MPIRYSSQDCLLYIDGVRRKAIQHEFNGARVSVKIKNPVDTSD